MHLSYSTHLYHLFTGDSDDRQHTRNITRKVPRGRTTDRPPRDVRAGEGSRGTPRTRSRGRTQTGGRGRHLLSNGAGNPEYCQSNNSSSRFSCWTD